MAAKKQIGVGIEYDSQGIRAAKVAVQQNGGAPNIHIEDVEYVHTDCTKEKNIIEGLKKIRSSLSINNSCQVATCIGGKQVYASQLEYKNLVKEEMKSGLKFEIRKNLPFDIERSILDYQIIGDDKEKKNKTVDVVVGSTMSSQITSLLHLYDQSSITLTVVDLLPMSIANVFWAFQSSLDEEEKSGVNAILYLGNDYSVVVIDGTHSMFFNRTIYQNLVPFSTHDSDQEGDADDTTGTNSYDVERTKEILYEELLRSITYYENNYCANSFSTLYCFGPCADASLLASIEEKSGLSIQPVNMSKILKLDTSIFTNSYELAASLAIRKEKKWK